MPTTVFIETPATFSFRHTVYSHGWSELPPFELDDKNWRLKYTFRAGATGKPVEATISEADGGLRIEVSRKSFNEKTLVRDVRHILRLDDPLEDFYQLTDGDDRLTWVSSCNAGRLLRSPTVFEDMVKTLCTTNCSWALTKNMTRNLVELLGEGSGNVKSFPDAKALASVDEKFYRDEIRAGYRSPYFLELAEAVASGELDPESWLVTDLPTSELKKEIKKVKGFGDYAADNLLKLLGRYDGLALDSWLRSQFYKKHNREKVCPDKKIERHYKSYGEWKGLAIWCDMTERWFDEKLTS
jgi:N-glycosylase/DNA lyase